MKTLFLALIAFVTLAFSPTTTETVDVMFDGYDGEGFSFSTVVENDEEDTATFYFTNVEKKLIEEFNLEAEDTVGKEFTITYSVKAETTENEDGEEETQEVYTLLSLEKKK